jgi:hypothetical protein
MILNLAEQIKIRTGKFPPSFRQSTRHLGLDQKRREKKIRHQSESGTPSRTADGP